MKFAHFLGNGTVRVEETIAPKPDSDELLLKVDSCGICGSEKDFFLNGTKKIIGHEVSGIVVDKGEECKVQEGTRGILWSGIYCGECGFCKQGMTNMCRNMSGSYGWTLPGGYAEYMCVKERCFLPLNSAISLEEGVILLDTIGVPSHALRKVKTKKVKTAAVFGCGPIGLGTIAVLRAFNVPKIYGIDLADYRLKYAEKLGAEPIDAKHGDVVAQVKEREKWGVDLVVEAIGNPITQNQALNVVDKGGKVIFLGHGPKLEIDPNVLILKNIFLIGSWYFPIKEFQQNPTLLMDGKIDANSIISHIFPLERIGEAFKLFLKGETAKVLIKCNV